MLVYHDGKVSRKTTSEADRKSGTSMSAFSEMMWKKNDASIPGFRSGVVVVIVVCESVMAEIPRDVF
jgi:hypothetical protein